MSDRIEAGEGVTLGSGRPGRWVLAMLLGVAGCADAEDDPAKDLDEPEDITALRWCLSGQGSGEDAEGAQRVVPAEQPPACVCLPVGTQPSTGSVHEAALIDDAVARCEAALAELGAVTTDCAERVRQRQVDYRGSCEPSS